MQALLHGANFGVTPPCRLCKLASCWRQCSTTAASAVCWSSQLWTCLTKQRCLQMLRLCRGLQQLQACTSLLLTCSTLQHTTQHDLTVPELALNAAPVQDCCVSAVSSSQRRSGADIAPKSITDNVTSSRFAAARSRSGFLFPTRQNCGRVRRDPKCACSTHVIHLKGQKSQFLTRSS